MDEAEKSATSAGYHYVRVDNIDNGFLPEKLEARGYQQVPRNDRNQNPDSVKDLRRIRGKSRPRTERNYPKEAI